MAKFVCAPRRNVCKPALVPPARTLVVAPLSKTTETPSKSAVSLRVNWMVPLLLVTPEAKGVALALKSSKLKMLAATSNGVVLIRAVRDFIVNYLSSGRWETAQKG